MDKKKVIVVVLECGDRFVYGGEKNMNELYDFMVWSTPTSIKCIDSEGNSHIFHSSRVQHIYEDVAENIKNE